MPRKNNTKLKQHYTVTLPPDEEGNASVVKPTNAEATAALLVQYDSHPCYTALHKSKRVFDVVYHHYEVRPIESRMAVVRDAQQVNSKTNKADCIAVAIALNDIGYSIDVNAKVAVLRKAIQEAVA